MNEFVAKVLYTELLARRSKIAILVEVANEVAVDACQQAIAPDVKFPLIYKERILNIFLYDCSLINSSLSFLSNKLLNLFEVFGDDDTGASICIFTWLDNPNILLALLLLNMLELFFKFVKFDIIKPVLYYIC